MGVFGRLRTVDSRLFGQLRDITGRLARSAALLERLLTTPRDQPAEIALALQRLDAEQAAVEHPDGNVRSFTGFAMRLDRMEYRELATALDQAAEAVQSAAVHVQGLHPREVPETMRALARTLTTAAEALGEAVPAVGTRSDTVVRRAADVERLSRQGESLYFEGVGALFDGTPDAVNVLRWKDMYETMHRALASCGRAATVLDRLSRT